jgi:hypothetical protein
MPYPTTIRLPEDVKRVLRKVAKKERRTVTQQINFVLQEWIKVDPALVALLRGRPLRKEEPQSDQG